MWYVSYLTNECHIGWLDITRGVDSSLETLMACVGLYIQDVYKDKQIYIVTP